MGPGCTGPCAAQALAEGLLRHGGLQDQVSRRGKEAGAAGFEQGLVGLCVSGVRGGG